MYKYIATFMNQDGIEQELILDKRVSFIFYLDIETGLPSKFSFTEGVNNLYKDESLLINFWQQAKNCLNLKIVLIENNTGLESELFQKEKDIVFECNARVREENDNVLDENHNIIIGLDIF